MTLTEAYRQILALTGAKLPRYERIVSVEVELVSYYGKDSVQFKAFLHHEDLPSRGCAYVRAKTPQELVQNYTECVLPLIKAREPSELDKLIDV